MIGRVRLDLQCWPTYWLLGTYPVLRYLLMLGVGDVALLLR